MPLPHVLWLKLPPKPPEKLTDFPEKLEELYNWCLTQSGSLGWPTELGEIPKPPTPLFVYEQGYLTTLLFVRYLVGQLRIRWKKDHQSFLGCMPTRVQCEEAIAKATACVDFGAVILRCVLWPPRKVSEEKLQSRRYELEQLLQTLGKLFDETHREELARKEVLTSLHEMQRKFDNIAEELHKKIAKLEKEKAEIFEDKTSNSMVVAFHRLSKLEIWPKDALDKAVAEFHGIICKVSPEGTSHDLYYSPKSREIAATQLNQGLKNFRKLIKNWPRREPEEKRPAVDSALEEHFRILATQWKGDRATSSAVKMAQHPAYKEIIEMGEVVVPLILVELERNPDHWFIALRTLTGADPVLKSHKGKLQRMTQDWLRWGRSQGHILKEEQDGNAVEASHTPD